MKWYHDTQVPLGREPLHVTPATLTVPWSIDAHPPAVHRRVVPSLVQWCRWDREDAWLALRRDAAQPKAPPVAPSQLPRHVRLAQVLEFVGNDALGRGLSASAATTLCRNTAERWSLGQLQVRNDPETGAVIGIE